MDDDSVPMEIGHLPNAAVPSQWAIQLIERPKESVPVVASSAAWERTLHPRRAFFKFKNQSINKSIDPSEPNEVSACKGKGNNGLLNSCNGTYKYTAMARPVEPALISSHSDTPSFLFLISCFVLGPVEWTCTKRTRTLYKHKHTHKCVRAEASIMCGFQRP